MKQELRGKQIILRPVGFVDLIRSLYWLLFQPEIKRFFTSVLNKDGRGWLLTIWNDRASRTFSFFVEENGEPVHVGGGGFTHIDFTTGVAEMGMVFGRKDSRGKGLGSDSTNVLLEYAFDDLGLSKVIGRIVEENAASRAMCRHFGFQDVSLEQNAVKTSHGWENLVHVEVTRDTWKRGD